MVAAAAARSWRSSHPLPLQLPRLLLLLAGVCLCGHDRRAHAALESYFFERFPVASLDVVCGVCNTGCGYTTRLLSRGSSPDALFIGALSATPSLDNRFNPAFQCFTPDTISVALYPSPTSKGSFARSALPTAISTVGFYTSVWGADASDSVTVDISNRLSDPVNLVGASTKSAIAASTTTLNAPANTFSVGPASSYLLEAFLASTFSVAGKWAAAVLFFPNPSAKNSYNVTYVVYYTDPNSSAGNTMLYSFEAMFTDSSPSSSSPSSSLSLSSSSASSTFTSSLKASSSAIQAVSGTPGADFASVMSSAQTCAIVQPPRPGCVPTSPSWPSCRFVCSS